MCEKRREKAEKKKGKKRFEVSLGVVLHTASSG